MVMMYCVYPAGHNNVLGGLVARCDVAPSQRLAAWSGKGSGAGEGSLRRRLGLRAPFGTVWADGCHVG